MHEKYMRRCLELAIKGLGQVRPNPLVGAVVVHNERIIGEGYHQKYGGPHAEVHALNSVKETHLLQESTVYVNLEPCAHHGKTPPCAELLVKFGVKRVVVGMIDPFPLVAGKGITILKNAGIEVISGVLENECRELNKRFLIFHEKQRPFVLLKWAQSSDKIIGSGTTERLMLTGNLTQKLVHKWRSEEAGILIGPDTAILDNPQLNVRHWTGEQPIKILLDRHLRVPTLNLIYNNDTPLLIYNLIKSGKFENTEWIKLDEKDFLSLVLQDLYTRNIQSVMVEGGAGILTEFIKQGLWDEARVLETNRIIGKGVGAPGIGGEMVMSERLGEDNCFYYYRS